MQETRSARWDGQESAGKVLCRQTSMMTGMISGRRLMFFWM
jgi:hypothetical protein